LIDTLFSLVDNSHGWNAAIAALVSAALYILITNIASRVANSPTSALAVRFRAAMHSATTRLLYEVLRLAFYVGVPFSALYLGWIDLRAVGLAQLDWVDGIRYAIVLLLAAWLLLMVIWLPYLHVTADVPAQPERQSFARRIIELIYMQAHWAFYRAAAIVFITGVVPDVYYWGTAIGLGLICVEAFANPNIRRQLTRIGGAESVVWSAGQAALNALVFIVTRNLYLLVFIHTVLEVTVPHLRAPLPANRTNQRRAMP
jgi:hypothetical protein